MPIKRIAFALLSLLGSTVVLACGSDDPTGADESSCADFCDHLASLCGQSSEQCESACASLDSSQRSCGLKAESCAAASTCIADTPPDQPSTPSGSSGAGSSSGGSSSGGSQDPCASCPLLTCTCLGEVREVRSCTTDADNQVVCATTCAQTSSCE